jgi:hypothetical protein
MSFAVRPVGLVGATGGTAFVFTADVDADTTNYNLRAAAVAAGWDQVAPLLATVTIASGIVVSADSTSFYAFDSGTMAYPTGSALALTNAGYIIGMGGAGGAYSANGLPGGAALRAIASLPVTLDNSLGTIGGGGGGGGGGFSAGVGYGGGGGRSGRAASAGGAGNAAGRQGADGLFASGGKGGGALGGAGGTTATGENAIGENGGGGGGWGAMGGSNTAHPTSGGAGGTAVRGNAYITWTATGTRYGSIS